MNCITGPSFTNDQILHSLRKTVQHFCQEQIAPQASTIDQENRFPSELWPLIGKIGMHGITAPTQYGGVDLGYLAHCIVMEEISRASASVGLSYGAHSNLCINQIVRHGTEDQKKYTLPLLCSGSSVGALAMSEHSAGSDVLSMRLTAKKCNGGYLLNGHKMWITNGTMADTIIVYAKTKPEDKAHGISAFIVDGNAQGLSRGNKLDKLGMRGSDTCELIFTDCFIPDDRLLGQPNQGLEILMSGLDYERVVLAAGPVGILQACLDLVLPYIKMREQFGKPLHSYQMIQSKIADIYAALNAARSYLYATAKNCDQGSITPQDAASVILFCAEQATKMAGETIQCLGGNGYINEYDAGRLWRDAKLYEIGAGTAEIRRIIIARRLSI